MTKETSPLETFASWFNSTFKAKKDDEAEDKKDDAAESLADEKDEDAMDEHGKPKMKKMVSKAVSTEFSVFKQTDGTWRWAGVTSSNFRDRDKKLVTLKALEDDVLRMTEAKEYGPLGWWHVEFKENDPLTQNPGVALDIASCDISEMAGAGSNLESGVFFDNAVGEAFAAHQKELGFSRDFWTPSSEPNAQGDFNRIHTFRRTILPREYASNLMGMTPLTILKETRMDKLARFKAIVGDAKADEILKQIETREKALESAGVVRKEVDVTEEFLGTMRKEFASKAEVEAITKSLASISDALTTFTTGFVASQTKERNELATTLKDIGDKVQELYGDAPNSLKTQKKSVAHADDTVSADSPAVKQALALAAAFQKQAGKSDSNDPFAEFANFAMPNANGH